ncbi:MAG: hypothetical protein IGS03_03950 [Candidatus Sericytochromatia bacterium]|nr:hypothetical protein [Candidatus Sericytochromatia bacterium]
MSITAVQSLSSVSGALASARSGKIVQGQKPTLSRDDIDWAQKLDRKMEYGYVPKAEEQARYNQVVQGLESIRDGGGYVYQDVASFSSNPRGVAAIGSLVGRTLSGGYIGYRYGHDIGAISRDTFHTIKNGIAAGDIPLALKGFATGVKQAGVISLKAGGISSAINAGISIVANVVETVAGRQTGAEGVGNVASDTVGGFLSGVGATAFSGASALGLSLAGVGGLPLTIMTVAGGAIGSVLTDKLYKGSGLFSVIKTKVTGLVAPDPAQVNVATRAA